MQQAAFVYGSVIFKPHHIRDMIAHSFFTDEELLCDVAGRLVLNQ